MMPSTATLAILAALLLAGGATSVWRRRRAAAMQKFNPPHHRSPLPADFDPNATRIISRPVATPGRTALSSASAVVIEGQARLAGLTGAHQGCNYPIHDRGLVLGRHTDCDIRLHDPRVSGRHAWVGIVDGRVILRDLKSTNGTFINAQVDTPIHEVTLRHGDTIVLGGHLGDQFHYRQLSS